ncbi:MAG TPA: hypothetical protein VHC22_07025 [Pirellulales bacterium]|nr:hypothetical protein [Pirellulales bacterium]
MTPRQLFRVVAASLGLWYMLRGSLMLLEAFRATDKTASGSKKSAFHRRFLRPRRSDIRVLSTALTMAMHLNEPSPHTTMYSYGVIGLFQMFIGFFVMCGVPGFDRMAFPHHHRETESGMADAGNSTTSN